MRGRAWIASGLLMALMAVVVVLLLTVGARWFLNARQTPSPPAMVQSGQLPQALADEIKRKEHAYYLLGMKDAVEFWHLTGIVPDTPALHDALWARHQASSTPLTGSEAQIILQSLAPEALP